MIIRAFLRVGCAAAVAFTLVAHSPGSSLSAADYTRYHTYDQLTAALRELAKAHPNLAKVVEVAKSREGRSVWAIEIANAAGTPPPARPALMIAANFEGDQVIGSALALYVAEQLLTGYAGNPAIKQRLDAHTFYIVPRANPDGAEAMFAPVRAARKTNSAKFDNDNDGRIDEDGPEDLNKDGFISVMRVKDPRGPFMVHPDDPRLLRRADAAKGEAGGYAIYWEGLDNDGDGFFNEDPDGGVDLNRNFQHQYPYYAPDAGPHMVSEPESRGLIEYVLARRNIAAILTFGESDNLIAPPTRTGGHAPVQTVDLLAFATQSVEGARQVGRFQSPQQFFPFGGRGGGDDDGGRGAAPGGRGAGQPRPTPPATTVAVTDLEYFRTISDRYRQLTGIRAAPATRIPGGGVLRVRLLPVRSAGVLNARMGNHRTCTGRQRGCGGCGWGTTGCAGCGGCAGCRGCAGYAGWSRSRYRHRRVRSAPGSVDGCRQGGWLHRVAAVQASNARGRRNRRLPPLCVEQSVARAHRGARKGTHRVRYVSAFALPEGVDRRHQRHEPRRRPLSHQGGSGEHRHASDVDRARSARTLGEADDGTARSRADRHRLRRRQDELFSGACRQRPAPDLRVDRPRETGIHGDPYGRRSEGRFGDDFADAEVAG
ncbi:MAG: hypothetical protein H0W18_05595 [Acidobacteria bacterium]|nr:hypothetical protein [Acidobacteriota bacterium]